MKVAHFISSCQAAGAELFTKSLAEELIKDDEVKAIELWVMMRVSELAPNNQEKVNFEKDFIKSMEENNIKVRFVDKKLKKGWFYTKKKIREFYHSFSPDIVHSHHETMTFHLCRSLAKYEVKLVETIHSNYIEYPFLHKYYLKNKLSTYIAISLKVGKLIENKIGVSSEKNHVIYNGVELAKFEFGEKLFDKEEINIIAVGRLTEVKDHRNLILSYKQLKEMLEANNIKVPELFLVGDGKLRENLIELTEKLNLTANIKFLGIRNDIPDLLRNSDLYVMSSELEGLSISLIEALVSGAAIVATDVGSNDEIIEEGATGLLVPKKNPKKLAEAMYKLIDNQELRKKFYNNSKDSSKKFDLYTSVQSHISIYKNL